MTIGYETLLLHLRIVGTLMAGLVAINLVVPFRLRWREEMSHLSLINRQIVQAHSAFIILILALLAILLLRMPEALLEPTRANRAVLLGLTIFWGLRMLMQWFFYSPETWRGHRFNTVAHYCFSMLWIYVTVVFGASLFMLRT